MFCPGYQISVKIVSSTATGGLLKTTLRSYLKIVHRNNVSFVSDQS